MRRSLLAFVCLAAMLVPRSNAAVDRPSPWTFPRGRDVYLMENDLVYARFLLLSRDGTYQQINRDEHGGKEVDRGSWEQEPAGTVRLHSTCRALRPRALSAGGLSMALTGDGAFQGLPLLLVSMRRFLAGNGDAVFAAVRVVELNTDGAPTVHVEGGAITFDRRDVLMLAARIEAALDGERTASYLLLPVTNAVRAIFVLREGVFGAADLAGVRRTYGVADGATPPFYFGRVEAKIFAAAVGRWEPLRLPGGAR